MAERKQKTQSDKYTDQPPIYPQPAPFIFYFPMLIGLQSTLILPFHHFIES